MKRTAVFAFVCLLAAAGATQAQILTGSIIGTVKDESGAVLPGVTVKIESPALPAGSETKVTTARGEYRFTELPRGTYSLTMELAGFGTYREEGLIVLVGGTIKRDGTLRLASVAETVTVTGESPLIDARKTGVTENISQEALETIPLHRMYPTEYAKWAGGVAASDPSGEGSAVSVLGSATSENSYLYDGVMTNNPSSGGVWGSGDLDAMEEIQVVMMGASAEYQVAQGGVFNIVFKQGTNSFSGDASGFWFPDALLSQPVKVKCNCPLGETGYSNATFRNYTGHFGGPIIRDRVWFYSGGNYDTRQQFQPGTDPTRAGEAARRWYSHAVFAKATWKINDRVDLKGSYNLDWWGGQEIPTIERPIETLVTGFGQVHTFMSEAKATLTPDTLLTVRANGWFDNYPNKGFTDDVTTAYRIDQRTGIACCGKQNFGKTKLYRLGQSAKVDHYIDGERASHDVRFGVQFEEARNHVFRAVPSGVWFADLGGRPDQATFRAPYVSGADYRSLGGWVEDVVSLARLTLSLGARFDRIKAISPDLPAVNNLVEETGETIEGLGDMFTWKSFSPRLGLNLKLTKDARTVLRANYSRAYRPVFLDEFQGVHPGLSPTTLTRWDPTTQDYTTILSVTDPIANLAVDPNMVPPLTDQVSIGLDRELTRGVRLSASYVYKHGEKQVGWKDVGGVYGTRDQVLPDGRTVTVVPLLNRTSERRFLRTNGPGTFNRYNGAIFTIEKRWSNRWSANVSYTFSKAKGLTTTGQDPNDNINNGGRIPSDRPHMFVGMLTYEVPGIDLMVFAQYMDVSGQPFAPQALVQLPQGRRSVNIEPATGEYRYPRQNILNFRLSRNVFERGKRRLEAGTELLNMLQDTAYNRIATANFFSSSFASPTQWIEPRRVNLFFRLAF